MLLEILKPLVLPRLSDFSFATIQTNILELLLNILFKKISFWLGKLNFSILNFPNFSPYVGLGGNCSLGKLSNISVACFLAKDFKCSRISLSNLLEMAMSFKTASRKSKVMFFIFTISWILRLFAKLLIHIRYIYYILKLCLSPTLLIYI